MNTEQRDDWTLGDGQRPAAIALVMIDEGVPTDGVAAYLWFASVLEAEVDPTEGDTTR